MTDLEQTSPTIDKNQRGADLSGRDFTNADLAGFDLTGADLSRARLNGADLSNASLRGANLQEALLVGADLTRADLTECKAEGSIFGQANLTDTIMFGADLTNATLSSAIAHRTDLRAATLSRTRLMSTDLTGADLSGAKIIDADLTGATVNKALFRSTVFTRSRLCQLVQFEKAEWIGVSVLDIDFSGAYLVRREIMDQNYLYEFRTRDRKHAALYRVWRATSDCGRSLGRWGALTLGVAWLFSIVYSLVDIDYGGNETFISPLYFSVVTITTLGYGDAVPRSAIAQALVMIQVAVGYMMLGGVLSIFATRMGRRAD